MAQRDVLVHLGAAQVEVAVLEAHLFVGDVVVGGREGQRLGVVEEAELVGDDFDFAGRDVRVDGAGIAQLDAPDDGDDVLGAQTFGLLVHLGPGVGGDDNLGEAGAIAQVNKDKVAEIAAAVDPSHENHGGAGVGGAESAAHMSALQIAKKIEHEVRLIGSSKVRHQFGAKNRELNAGREVLYRELAGFHFILADDDDVARASFFGGLEGFLQPEGFIAEIGS